MSSNFSCWLETLDFNTSLLNNVTALDLSSLGLGEAYVMFFVILLLTVCVARAFGMVRSAVFSDKVNLRPLFLAA
jgi:hypothetical protein